MDTGLDWVQPILTIVQYGGIGAVMWYLLIKDRPALEARHENERRGWLEHEREHLQATVELTSEIEALTGRIDRLEIQIGSLTKAHGHDERNDV